MAQEVSLSFKRRLLMKLNRAARSDNVFGYGDYWYTLGIITGATGKIGHDLEVELSRWESETGVDLIDPMKNRFKELPVYQLNEYDRCSEG